MYRHLLIAAALGLAACATPAERCISDATKGFTEIDAQIAEAETNLARGYAIADPVIDTVGVDVCSGSGNVRICLGGTHDVEGRHVPIDARAERARLAALRDRRAAMEVTAERQIAACQKLK